LIWQDITQAACADSDEAAGSQRIAVDGGSTVIRRSPHADRIIFMTIPRFKPRTKITLLAVFPELLMLVATTVTLLLQGRRLALQVDSNIHDQANSKAAKIARNVYLFCES
jgi:hypothetical protein